MDQVFAGRARLREPDLVVLAVAVVVYVYATGAAAVESAEDPADDIAAIGLLHFL